MLRHSIPGALAGVALVVAALAGCGGGGMSAEMRQQEADMAAESNTWKSDIGPWKTRIEEMRAWHANHAAIRDSSLAREVRGHEEKIAEHEAQIAEFERDLDVHIAKVQEEAAKPERDRMLAHAALWADHTRLNASHALLASAQEGLVKEHDELAAKIST